MRNKARTLSCAFIYLKIFSQLISLDLVQKEVKVKPGKQGLSEIYSTPPRVLKLESIWWSILGPFRKGQGLLDNGHTQTLKIIWDAFILFLNVATLQDGSFNYYFSNQLQNTQFYRGLASYLSHLFMLGARYFTDQPLGNNLECRINAQGELTRVFIWSSSTITVT